MVKYLVLTLPYVPVIKAASLRKCFWRSEADSKYWCNQCYFQSWHTTNLQFILLFTTLFIQPVQIEPQTPLQRPRSSLAPSNFAFPLDLCVMSWLGLDRLYSQVCLQKERRRCTVNVTLAGRTLWQTTKCTFSSKQPTELMILQGISNKPPSSWINPHGLIKQEGYIHYVQTMFRFGL